MDMQHAATLADVRLAPSAALRRRSITQDDSAETLGGEILRGIHAPGQALPSEAMLLERFGVSRTVLREVFKTLAAKGFLSSRAGVGTRVLEPGCWNLLDPCVLAWKADHDPEPDFQRQLTELLRVVGPAVAGLAASRATPALVAEMRRCLAVLGRAGASRSLRQAAIADFQRCLAQASGNDLMMSLSGTLHGAWANVGAPDALNDQARRERLVDAIEARDGELAARLALELTAR
jgi:DNA-binding FadR family transcriptional regulator